MGGMLGSWLDLDVGMVDVPWEPPPRWEGPRYTSACESCCSSVCLPFVGSPVLYSVAGLVQNSSMDPASSSTWVPLKPSHYSACPWAPAPCPHVSVWGNEGSISPAVCLRGSQAERRHPACRLFHASSLPAAPPRCPSPLGLRGNWSRKRQSFFT